MIVVIQIGTRDDRLVHAPVIATTAQMYPILPRVSQSIGPILAPPGGPISVDIAAFAPSRLHDCAIPRDRLDSPAASNVGRSWTAQSARPTTTTTASMTSQRTRRAWVPGKPGA